MALEQRDIEHIFQRLRDGLVPARGLDAFAVGIERQRGELRRLLKLVSDSQGLVKFLRGGYGCGKTFMAQLAVLEAQAQGFATSFVVVSDNDLRFYKFDDVYSKVVTELGTKSCPRGALGDLLDRWVAKVEDSLIAGGADEDAEDFDEQVTKRLSEDLASMTKGKAPDDFVRVVRSIFELKQAGEFNEAGALISWLSGSGNVAASAKKRAAIKGEIGSRDALAYLRGIVEIIKAAGYKGLVIVIDEVETILRTRKDSRNKSLNGIRQICDNSADFPGLLWVFTGTPDFFESRRGVAGLEPLYDRIKFMKQGGFASLRQAQLELKPFDDARLVEVALKLRELFPTTERARLEARISDEFIDSLVSKVTAGFGGDVGVVPRQFLRQFVNHCDLVHENEDYDPQTVEGFEPQQLTPEEEQAQKGERDPSESGDDLVPVEDVW